MSEKYTDEIIEIEFDLFDKVQNEGGRASCQDDFTTFQIMRGAQFDAWSEPMRESYLNDLKVTKEQGRNLVLEKYAYMSGYEYMGEEEDLIEKQTLLLKIMNQMHDDTLSMRKDYPHISRASRPMSVTQPGGTASIDQYLLCELMTYSVQTLRLYQEYLEQLAAEGKSLPRMTLENTAERYGFANMDEFEQMLAEHQR